MQLFENISSLSFIALYAETHFRFSRWFPSFLFSCEPEVIFDAPRRLEPGEDLLVMLMVNDLHRFPAELSGCAIAVSRQNETPKRYNFPAISAFEVEHPFRHTMRAFLLRIPRSELPGGLFHITCTIIVKCGSRLQAVINDNLRGTSKLSFSCFAADDHLPGSEFCSYGDLHIHSQYSQSHVEFGPPITVIDSLAHSSGLSFAAITDHSYDFASSMDNYLMPDPDLERWKTFQSEISENKRRGVIIIPGEEVSCLNNKKEVVHLCGLGLMDFIPGNLDGARKNRQKDRQLTVAETVQAIHEQGGIASAAHPGVKPGYFQRLFLRRGAWSEQDMQCGIDAMQILNNGFTPSWSNGKSMWINMLQRGYNVPLAAGNDAHGDFNRYRALTIPFFSIGENQGRFMGYAKTGVYGKRRTVSSLIAGIREGATFITTGPFAAISLSDSCDEKPVISNRPISGDVRELYIHAISTPEYGPVRTVEVFGSEYGAGQLPEKSYFNRCYTEAPLKVCERIERSSLPGRPLYLRMEVVCDAPANLSGKSAAFTSAVFLG
jgi:hypothetical protein